VKVLSILIITLFVFTACASNTPPSTEKNQPTTSPQQNADAKTVKVNIVNFKFDPAVVTINKGDTIIWTNNDSASHAATGTAFDSGSLCKGATFKFTFNTPNTFDYVCSFHPQMKGQVIVK